MAAVVGTKKTKPKTSKKSAAVESKKPKEKKKIPRKPASPRFVEKQIGGDKNGGTRRVAVKRSPRFYPTQEKSWRLRTHKKPFSQHKRYLRESITPGTVLILLAGKHKGKRVVFLKQLASGLLLVTGPYHLSGCPLRRINAIYVIATKTKLDISGVKIPDRVNDAYFKRKELKKQKPTENQIFSKEEVTYFPSEERKEDQRIVDDQVLTVIRQHPEKKYIFGYLGAMFSLGHSDRPHKMVF